MPSYTPPTTSRNSFFFQDPAPPLIYTLSLHDALPISEVFYLGPRGIQRSSLRELRWMPRARSEEHTSELQSRFDLVCRLLLEKKNPRSRQSASPDPGKGIKTNLQGEGAICENTECWTD